MAAQSFFANPEFVSYAAVRTEGGIETVSFLEASKGLVSLFGIFNSTAFTMVMNDMNGNIDKINKRYQVNPSANKTLQDLAAGEQGEKKRTATEGLLWLNRGLEFTSHALRRSVNNPEEELSVSFTESYKNTLSKYHSFVVKPVFTLAMKACPARADFYAKLGADGDGFSERMGEWLTTLESIVAELNRLYTIEHPEYSKF